MQSEAIKHDLEAFARDIRELGKRERARMGKSDLAYLRTMTFVSRVAEITGRLLLQFAPSPLGWFAGMSGVTLHLSFDSQIMHTIEHGAFVGLKGAEAFTPERFETLAIPLQARTWGLAHGIHHRVPSLPGQDPDVLHGLYRVHKSQKWRPWHVFNTFLGEMVTFEHCAFTYDRLLKKEGLRPKGDRSEIIKYVSFVLYQYVLFPAMAGPRWKAVLAAGVMATVIRNLILAGLQMGSSVGHEVSTEHDANFGRKAPGEWCRFQVETSKNWVVANLFKPILGGLDRHIEHHLYSNLPPPRLHAVSGEVQALCRKHGIKYREYPTFLGSLRDSLSYLWLLSMPSSADR